MGHDMADQLLLPVTVVGKPDVIRLIREVEGIDDFLQQAKVRKGGQSLQLPKTSQQLEDLASANNLNLLQDQDRIVVAKALKSVLDNAPTMHISFASNPSVKFMERITAWFRQEIGPGTLIEVGLQPNIAAGFTLRTTSKYFDMSLRKTLVSKEDSLLEKLRSSA